MEEVQSQLALGKYVRAYMRMILYMSFTLISIIDRFRKSG